MHAITSCLSGISLLDLPLAPPLHAALSDVVEAAAAAAHAGEKI
jgi:hypothetical protein